MRLSGAWTEGEVWMVEFSAREDWVDDGSVRENMKGRERVGVVVVYDVCDPGSFEVLKTWWRMRRASGLAGGDRARRGEVRKGDVCPPGVMDAKVHEAGDNGGEKGGGSGRPTSVLAVYHRCLSRFAASPPSLHSASASTAVSITGHSAMPLALIATTTRVAGTVSRDVSSSEGEALAQDMDVPFFELSIPEAEMPEKDGRDVEAPLREFWGTYKRKWMQERRENEDEYETRK